MMHYHRVQLGGANFRLGRGLGLGVGHQRPGWGGEGGESVTRQGWEGGAVRCVYHREKAPNPNPNPYPLPLTRQRRPQGPAPHPRRSHAALAGRRPPHEQAGAPHLRYLVMTPSYQDVDLLMNKQARPTYVT
eukprot:scaffold2987_cov30-Phaeocystis_antarctica.AAC.3